MVWLILSRKPEYSYRPLSDLFPLTIRLMRMYEAASPCEAPSRRSIISRMSALRTQSATVVTVCSLMELYRPYRYQTFPATKMEMAVRQMAVIILNRFTTQM